MPDRDLRPLPDSRGGHEHGRVAVDMQLPSILGCSVGIGLFASSGSGGDSTRMSAPPLTSVSRRRGSRDEALWALLDWLAYGAVFVTWCARGAGEVLLLLWATEVVDAPAADQHDELGRDPENGASPRRLDGLTDRGRGARTAVQPPELTSAGRPAAVRLQRRRRQRPPLPCAPP